VNGREVMAVYHVGHLWVASKCAASQSVSIARFKRAFPPIRVI
jgi:hypothetical protein